MKRIICASFPLLLVGCTTLDANSNFSDAIDSIEEKQNYTLVVGKSLTPIANPQRGGQLVKSSLELNYVAPLKNVTSVNNVAAPDSFISMEMTYFKTYDEYKFALVDGKDQKIPLVNYAAISETCSDICTQTQYFNIPLSKQDIEQGAVEDLSFDVAVSDKDKINFIIPAGYIEAIVDRGNASPQVSTSSTPMAAATTTAVSVAAVPVIAAATEATPASVTTSEPVAVESKSQEMTQYWFEQLSETQKESMTQWAVEHRKTTKIDKISGSQAEQMFGYWFNKANEQERKNIIIRLLD